MSTHLKIDFVSDIACPWCAVGLGALEMALERLNGEVKAELHFQPFELNPQMPAAGQHSSRRPSSASRAPCIRASTPGRTSACGGSHSGGTQSSGHGGPRREPAHHFRRRPQARSGAQR